MGLEVVAGEGTAALRCSDLTVTLMLLQSQPWLILPRNSLVKSLFLHWITGEGQDSALWKVPWEGGIANFSVERCPGGGNNLPFQELAFVWIAFPWAARGTQHVACVGFGPAGLWGTMCSVTCCAGKARHSCPAKGTLLSLLTPISARALWIAGASASTGVLAAYRIFVSLTNISRMTSTPVLNKHSHLFERTFVL